MKKLSLLLSLFVTTNVTLAQELETILLAADDASKLMQGYLNPASKGLMYSMNGGWYTTAKTHKVLGFDLTISANGSFVPSADEMFAFIPSDYQFLSLPNNESSIPTVMSDNDASTMVDVSVPVGDGTFKVASFEMPGGITEELPANVVPTPMVQAGIGLPLHTDLKIRFAPTVSYSDNFEANLIGIGLQHNLMQYLGPLDKLPLSLSVLAAFTKIDATYNIGDESADGVSVTNGSAGFELNTWTAQLLGSLDFKIVTIYGGLGYNSGKTSLKMNGTYNLSYDIDDGNGNIIGSVDESITDPIDLEFDVDGFRGTIGTRLNLAWFKIFADYTLQEYNTATVGIAFSFR
ncbi:DUF6588 family protein [Flavobacteriaceae sp. LMIT009]